MYPLGYWGRVEIVASCVENRSHEILSKRGGIWFGSISTAGDRKPKKNPRTESVIAGERLVEM